MLIKYLSLVVSMLCLVALSACTSMSILVPDMAMQSPKKISLENAQGPISNQSAKKIIANIKKDGLETNIFDKHLVLTSTIVVAR